MDTEKDRQNAVSPPSGLASKKTFSRLDDSDDALFYARDRFVHHLDSLALATIKVLIGDLITGDQPMILDLMASWDSHLPQSLSSARVTGLGLNPRELASNSALAEWVLHDLNQNPQLPFPDEIFDAVINTVSVDYMTRPFEVFAEAARILKPGGLLLVIFSNRMFPQKAVSIWQESTEEERVRIVEAFFGSVVDFDVPRHFVSKGRPRPRDDKYAYLGIPSDPVYAVYARKKAMNHTR